MPVIREYRPEDKPSVHACFVELQDYLHRLESNILEGRAAGKYFDFILTRCAETAGKIFVAEVDNQIVGFVCVFGKVPYEEFDEEPIEYAFISDLVVLPAYRSQGIGQLLLHAAEEHARAQGAASLELAVLVKNESAVRLYNRYGFRGYHYLLKKPLC